MKNRDPLTPVKLGRFAIRSKAVKRIAKATHGNAHFTGQWLVIDGKVARRDEAITSDELERAEVLLGYGTLDMLEHPSSTRFACLVDYRAVPGEIEEGWRLVADRVCDEHWDPA